MKITGWRVKAEDRQKWTDEDRPRVVESIEEEEECNFGISGSYILE
jgi:hypothetical protein